MLSKIWVAFLVLACVGGVLFGRMDAVSQAAAQGAGQAVQLLIEIVGLMMFWSGMMELVSASGLGSKIACAMRPILSRIFGEAGRDAESMELVSANVTANLLGLSNAATPLGLRAADRLYQTAGRKGNPDRVLMLIILNTTSIQLIPSTIAAVRAGLGAELPFDIMPAVWGASIGSVIAALMAAHFLRRFFPERT